MGRLYRRPQRRTKPFLRGATIELGDSFRCKNQISMDEELAFDLVVIGSGPAGEKGSAQAAYFGKRVALVEKAPALGGASVHTGTLPSKTLREASVYLSGHRQRELYGISLSL